jgi:cysteine desulfurase
MLKIKKESFVMDKVIYVDHAATTPTRKEVLEEMIPYFTEKFGNASSVHSLGRESRKAVEASREKVAKAIGAQPKEIYFTGGGTEADNWAIKGIAYANREKGNHHN